MQHDSTETSVMISLRELAALESDRQAEEERERALAEAEAEAARREAIAEREALEAARRAAEEADRVERRRREAEEAARVEAIERAEIERARLEVEATARRELVEAQNRHERELARLNDARRTGRLRKSLLAGIAITLIGGGAAAFGVNQHVEEQTRAHEARIAQLDAERQRLHDEGLGSLDRLHAQLESRIGDGAGGDLAAARERAATIRQGLTLGSVDEKGLDAFEGALDSLRIELVRQEGRDRLARLDELHGELRTEIERVRRPSETLAKAEASARTARRLLDEHEPSASELAAFERALGVLTGELSVATRKGPTPSAPVTIKPPVEEEVPCDPKDPMAFCLP